MHVLKEPGQVRDLALYDWGIIGGSNPEPQGVGSLQRDTFPDHNMEDYDVNNHVWCINSNVSFEINKVVSYLIS